MTTRPYKFLVTPIVQQVDDDGTVTGEVPLAGDTAGGPIVLFGCDSLAKWAAEFPATLDAITPAST